MVNLVPEGRIRYKPNETCIYVAVQCKCMTRLENCVYCEEQYSHCTGIMCTYICWLGSQLKTVQNRIHTCSSSIKGICEKVYTRMSYLYIWCTAGCLYYLYTPLDSHNALWNRKFNVGVLQKRQIWCEMKSVCSIRGERERGQGWGSFRKIDDVILDICY